jgi:hypothetical protein
MGITFLANFATTLIITEVKNAWTAHYALKTRLFSGSITPLITFFPLLLLPIGILHSDNNGEFIDNAVVS